MKPRSIGIALVLACCGPSLAKADWNYTKWGMTPQQVASASKNTTKDGSDVRPDSDGNVSKLVAPYRDGGVTYEAQFGFDAANKLASVTLVLDDPSASMDMDMSADAHMHMTMNKGQGACRDLQTEVKATYGAPQGGGSADMLYIIETWRDQKTKNDIKYTVLYGTGCYVQYSAIKSAGAH